MSKAQAIDGLIQDLNVAFPGHPLESLMRTAFEQMTDSDMEDLVQQMESGDFIIPIVVPNLSEFKLDQQAILDFAKSVGHEFFQRIWMTDTSDPTKVFLTPKKYLVVDLVTRRQAQTIDDKMSVPKVDTVMDDLTGQSIGESKGSAVTFPELQLLNSYGLDESIIELIKIRGGDNVAYRNLENQIVETGVGQIEAVIDPNSRPKTVTSLSTLLKTAHIGNNL
jgi:hypothetical protein